MLSTAGMTATAPAITSVAIGARGRRSEPRGQNPEVDGPGSAIGGRLGAVSRRAPAAALNRRIVLKRTLEPGDQCFGLFG